MKTQHTPGPWHVGMKQAEKIIYNAEGWAVANATVYHGKEDAETVQANAKLIAAAPEMLELLKGLKPVFKHLSETYEPDDPSAEWLGHIHEAIAKAKGGA